MVFLREFNKTQRIRMKRYTSPQLGFLLLISIASSINLTTARITKCISPALANCFCGEQFVDRSLMFVVNCTNTGFTDTNMLLELPEQTNMIIFTGNHVGTIPSNVFGEDAVLSALKIIDFSNNGIRDIKGKAFHHVGNVERLILNHNNISISEDDDQNFHHARVFSNFNNLKELHLTNAFADNTDAALAIDLHDIFINSGLTKLYKLHLEQNEIKSFRDDRVFCDLQNLHDLYLGENSIPSLNFNVLCLKKLRYLDLEYNNITKFSQKDLDMLDKLATLPERTEDFMLEIGGNAFKCDNAIKNLYTWLQNTPVKIRNLEKLECSQAKYGRKYIVNLKNLGESKHAKVSKALMVLLVILVCILLSLLSAYIYLKKDNVRSKLAPIFEAVTRKVQYTTIESQEV